MSNFPKNANHGQAVFVIFCIRQAGVSSLTASLTAEQFVRLLQENANVCESAVREMGGSIVNIISECIFAAWNTEDSFLSDVNYVDIACDLIRRLSAKRDAQKSVVSISITKGQCVFEREGEAYKSVVGMPWNRSAILSEKYTSESQSSLIIEESLMPFVGARKVEQVAPSVWKIGLDK
jgi:class 3 adenylate cyclase